MENGKNSPSMASLKGITRELDVTIGELFAEPRGEQVTFLKNDQCRAFAAAKDKVTFALGGETYRMESGDSIYFRSRVPCRRSNPGDQPMRATWVVTPASF